VSGQPNRFNVLSLAWLQIRR